MKLPDRDNSILPAVLMLLATLLCVTLAQLFVKAQSGGFPYDTGISSASVSSAPDGIDISGSSAPGAADVSGLSATGTADVSDLSATGTLDDTGAAFPWGSAEEPAEAVFLPEDAAFRAVIVSDLHFADYEPFILSVTAPLQARIEPIARTLFDEVIAIHPDVFILCGDNTNSGDLSSMQRLAELLSAVTDAGIPVVLCPGNHDYSPETKESYRDIFSTVLNRDRQAENTEIPHLFETSDSPDFASTAGASGSLNLADTAAASDSLNFAGTADASDGLNFAGTIGASDSLSYACSIGGIRLIAMDDNYEGNGVYGKYTETDLRWLEDQLQAASAAAERIILITHHNLFRGCVPEHEENYLLQNEGLKDLLARYHVRLVLSGHRHAQEILYDDASGIYEIISGFPSSYPFYFGTLALCEDVLYYQAQPIDFAHFGGSYGAAEIPAEYEAAQNQSEAFASAIDGILSGQPLSVRDKTAIRALFLRFTELYSLGTLAVHRDELQKDPCYHKMLRALQDTNYGTWIRYAMEHAELPGNRVAFLWAEPVT